mgnify:CR=1 FL=1
MDSLLRLSSSIYPGFEMRDLLLLGRFTTRVEGSTSLAQVYRRALGRTHGSSVVTGDTAGRSCYGHSCEGEAICIEPSWQARPGSCGNHYTWKVEVIVLQVTFHL